MYRHNTTVQLYDTDAAGLLFFGNHFRLAHDAYQAYLSECGFTFDEIIKAGNYLIPLAHASADYLEPLGVNDKVVVVMVCSKISDHSFVLEYELTRDDRPVSRVKTVHVCIDRTTGQKIPVPEKLVDSLKAISPN